MFRNILTFLILYPFSRISGIVGTIGGLLPVHRAYRWVYDKLVGIENARRWRDDHMQRVAEIVADRDNKIEKTPKELVNEIEEGSRRVERLFSDGESVLSLSIGIASFTAPPVVALILATVLIISVSVRLTTIQTLAYDNPDPNDDIEHLYAMRAWNEKVLSSKNVTGSLISLRTMKGISESLYERYLDEVFAPTVQDFSRRKALKRFWAVSTEELWEIESEGEEEDQEDEISEEDNIEMENL